MDCCGGAGEHKGHGSGGKGGGINWVQIVALGLIAMLVLGFVLGR